MPALWVSNCSIVIGCLSKGAQGRISPMVVSSRKSPLFCQLEGDSGCTDHFGEGGQIEDGIDLGPCCTVKIAEAAKGLSCRYFPLITL